MDEGERELHEHGRHEREEQRETLPEVVGAVGGAQVERRRGLGREQGYRHQDGRGESHPHSRSAIRGGSGFARGRHAHNGSSVPLLVGRDTERGGGCEEVRGLPSGHCSNAAAAAAAAAAARLRSASKRAGCYDGQVWFPGETAGGARGAGEAAGYRGEKKRPAQSINRIGRCCLRGDDWGNEVDFTVEGKNRIRSSFDSRIKGAVSAQ